MNLRPFVAPFLLALAGFAACAPERPDAAPDARSAQGVSVDCPTRTAVWQNKLPQNQPCKVVKDTNQDGGFWSVEPLFNANVGRDAREHCRYTWNKPELEPDYAELNAQFEGAELPGPERDCPAVAALAPPDMPSEVDAIWQPLRDQYQRQAGQLTEPLPRVGKNVRVAVLDTSKAPYDDVPIPSGYDHADEHGRLVGRVIGDLACPGAFGGEAGCAAEIVNYPALARKDGRSTPTWHAGPPAAGFYGSLSELAEAIEHAVRDWHEARAQGGPQRLVLNLSLGWSPEFGGELVTKPNQPVDLTKLPQIARPVYDALARATCAGAVVVAAAGNYDLASSGGMTYPAAWESVPAPDEFTCRTRYPLPAQNVGPLPVFPPRGENAYRPLVYAAGAVDQADLPAGISRKGGLPRLAAYGVGVVTSEPRTGGATRIKTGTSLAAAVTSGAASLAWAYAPERRPDQIMQVVYDSGQKLGRYAEIEHDVCDAEPCSGFEVRRVSACEAAVLARCGGGECDIACATVPAGTGEPASAAIAWGDYGLPLVGLAPAGCAPPNDCLGASTDTTQGHPWVGPQPGSGGCDTCLYSGKESKLVLGLDKYARPCAYQISAAVETDAGTQIFSATPPAAAGAPAALSPHALAPAPAPPFLSGIYEMSLPVDPSRVRSVTLWFHTDDGDHEGGAYTRVEGIPVVR